MIISYDQVPIAFKSKTSSRAGIGDGVSVSPILCVCRTRSAAVRVHTCKVKTQSCVC